MMPMPIREFQNVAVSLMNSVSTWMAIQSDPELDRCEYVRNLGFSFLINGLLDIQRSSRPDLDRIEADHAAMQWAYVRHYLPLTKAAVEGAADVLSGFTRAEQIAMIEFRHQAAHGHRRGVLQNVRTVVHFSGGVAEERLTNGQIFEVLAEKWAAGSDSFMTAMRSKLGPRPCLFWELLGALRVLNSLGVIPVRDVETAVQFAVAPETPVLTFAEGGYFATQAERGTNLPTFFEVCRTWGPQEAAAVDPFVEAARNFLETP